MLAEILHKVAEFETEDHVYYPRPSMAGPQRCIRQMDYYAQGYERKPFPGRFVTVLDDSSWHEELIKGWIRKSAFQVHSEQMEVVCGEVRGHKIKGHIDGVITDILGIDRLLEIKALSHFGFQGVWGGELPLDYIAQTCLYLRGIREINPDLCYALLFIKNKNQAQYLEIGIYYDWIEDKAELLDMILSTGEKRPVREDGLVMTIEGAVGKSIEKFEAIEQYRDEKKLHDRPYKRDSWRCEYCPYGETCWASWEEEFDQRGEQGSLMPEDEDLCRYYKQKSAEVSEMEDEKKELGEKIKKLMADRNIKAAQGKEYQVSVRAQTRETIDNLLIPPAILERAKKISAFEVLNVKKIGQTNGKKGARK